jgi:hypothetical protein
MSEEIKKKHIKKRIMITVVIMAAVLLVMYLLTLILPLLSSNVKNKQEEGTADFNFYTPDFDENIFEDEEYMALIANGVLKYDNAANSIIQLNSDNAGEHGDAVKFLVDFVDSIIDGDSTRYNSFFSKEYFKTNKEKSKFTMQKIYDGTITYYSAEGVTDNGNNYTKYIYKLSYSIIDNNGTFRNDIGEDQKTQYIVITNREGTLKIDAISTSKYK